MPLTKMTLEWEDQGCEYSIIGYVHMDTEHLEALVRNMSAAEYSIEKGGTNG